MIKHIPFYADLLEYNFGDKKPTLGIVLLYGAVEFHASGEKGCIASNKTLAKETGLKESSVKTLLSEMHKHGWIYVETDEYNHRKLITPLMYINTPSMSINPPRQSPLTINTVNRKTVNKESYVETQNVYDHYIKSFNKNPSYYKLTDSRKKKIRRRLKEYSVDVLLKAIDNVANSPWHTGDNDRGWKADLDWIIRSEEQVGKLAEMEVKQGERIAHMKLNLETGKMEEIYE